MTELVLAEQTWHCPPERPCDGRECGRPAASSALWWDRENDKVVYLEVCGLHRWAFEGRGLPLQFFELDAAPPVEYAAQRIREHLQAQRYAGMPTSGMFFQGGSNFIFNWNI